MPENAIDLARQARQHLESLSAAGVLFVPKGEPIVVARAPLRVAPSQVAPQGEVEVAPQEDPFEGRLRELEVLRNEVTACDKCSELFATRLQTVFGTGPLDAEVMFVGEAPGSAEDAQGEPFVDKGGQLLRRIIAACQLPSSQEYLVNVIKCRPPRNRAPTMTECGNCRDFFRRQFDLVKPKFVVALGPLVSKLLSGKNQALAALRGQVHAYRETPLVCTNHPDDIESDETGRLKRETWEDMKLLLRTMGRDVPGAK